MNISLKQIGVAKNQEKKHFGGWDTVQTDIIINPEYQDALLGLKDFSHVVVIFWMHEVKRCDIRHVPQGKRGEVPEVGIFACRCAERPNPIGISTVKIVGIKDNIVTVQGLDVINDTIILDIKPYTPQYDRIENPRYPEWVDKLEY